MKKIKITLLVILVLSAVAAYVGYKLYNKDVKQLAGSKADLNISASDLINKFESDEGAANKEFLSKKTDFIITVSGTVKEVIKDDGTYTVVLGDSTTPSSVRCSIDPSQNQQAASLQTGSHISIKGAITGFMKYDMGIGSDVVLNRCIIEVKK